MGGIMNGIGGIMDGMGVVLWDCMGGIMRWYGWY